MIILYLYLKVGGRVEEKYRTLEDAIKQVKDRISSINYGFIEGDDKFIDWPELQKLIEGEDQ